MPIRIYKLAKELALDTKVVVDICTKLGITVKGSALASLSDEEVAKIREFISGSGKQAGAPKKTRRTTPEADAALDTFTRDDYIAPTGTDGKRGQMPVIPSRPKKPAPAETEPEVAETPEIAEPEVAEEVTPTAPTETTDQTAVEPQPVVAETTEEIAPEKVPDAEKTTIEAEAPEVEEAATTARPQRDTSLPPLPSRNGQTTLPDLPSRKKGEPETETNGRQRPRQQRTGPSIKLAPMPKTPEAPKKKTGKDEPAPQKPDIRLPMDAIRAAKQGSAPLSEHLRRHEIKKADRKAQEEGGPKKGEGEKKKGKDKGRRGAATFDTEAAEKEERSRRERQKRKSSRRRNRGDLEEAAPQQTAPMPFRRKRRPKRGAISTAEPRKEAVTVELPCTVRSFSQAVGVSAAKVLAKLMTLDLGTLPSITSTLDMETAEMVAMEMEIEVNFRQPQSLEDQVLEQFEHEDSEDQLQPRPAVITFLGHVDHGKTSLLDRIIAIDVVSGEKGGITQHIRAYRIEKDDQAIAFVDTPGHEAFTEMRARGANVTDIAVLVIAADDGVMPQTEEAISHARAAGVPIVVALNKIDLPGVDINRTFQQLAAAELLPTEWGGDIEVVKTSAQTGEGIDDLLETLLTVAELHEYKANPDRAATGTCIESELNEGRGVTAKLLVQNGTLNVGDIIVCGESHGRIKAMYDTLDPNRQHESAGPSTPVNVTGLNIAPGAGDRFYVLDDISKARELADQRSEAMRQRDLAGGRPHVTLENLFDRLEEQSVQSLNVILRADVRGSIEAIRKEISKLEHPEIKINILQATVGGITEADVHLADASDAVIIGFNVVPDEGARSLSENRGVQIRRYDIIYQITEDLRAAMEGMLKPEKQEAELGRALVKQTFQISRLGTIAGCQVLSGILRRDARVRVIRDNRIIGDYPLESLRREKDDAREVRAGFECGIKIKGFNDLKPGDVVEAYVVEEVARTL